MVDNYAKKAIEEGQKTTYLCTSQNIMSATKTTYKNRCIGISVVRQICWIRFNNALVPSHQHKIKLNNHPFCTYVEIEDIEHKMLNC